MDDLNSIEFVKDEALDGSIGLIIPFISVVIFPLILALLREGPRSIVKSKEGSLMVKLELAKELAKLDSDNSLHNKKAIQDKLDEEIEELLTMEGIIRLKSRDLAFWSVPGKQFIEYVSFIASTSSIFVLLSTLYVFLAMIASYFEFYLPMAELVFEISGIQYIYEAYSDRGYQWSEFEFFIGMTLIFVCVYFISERLRISLHKTRLLQDLDNARRYHAKTRSTSQTSYT